MLNEEWTDIQNIDYTISSTRISKYVCCYALKRIHFFQHSCVMYTLATNWNCIEKLFFFLAPLLQWTTPSDSIKLNSAAAVNSSAVWFHLTKSHLVCAVGAHCFWFCAPLIHYYSCSSACTAASTSRSCGRDHTDVCVVIFGSSGSVQFGHLQNNHWRP